MESPDEVFSTWMIDPRLTTYGRVDLRQQSSRNLRISDPALIRRCGKPRDVADHAAAEGDYDSVAMEARVHERIQYRPIRVQCFELLAIGQGQDGSREATQSALQT